MFLNVCDCAFLIRLILCAAAIHTACAATLCIKVLDPADLPLPDATVAAINLQTTKAWHGRTDEAGLACIPKVPEGLYSVEAGLTGFLNVRYHPVRVAAATTHKVRFRLPFGEISEGPIAQEATLSGTLRRGENAVQNARICILSSESGASVSCATTDDLGEYAIIAPIGRYTLEVQLHRGAVQRSNVDISRPGLYRNIVSVSKEE